MVNNRFEPGARLSRHNQGIRVPIEVNEQSYTASLGYRGYGRPRCGKRSSIGCGKPERSPLPPPLGETFRSVGVVGRYDDLSKFEDDLRIVFLDSLKDQSPKPIVLDANDNGLPYAN